MVNLQRGKNTSNLTVWRLLFEFPPLVVFMIREGPHWLGHASHGWPEEASRRKEEHYQASLKRQQSACQWDTTSAHQSSAPVRVTGSSNVERETTLKATWTSSCQKAQSIVPENGKAGKVRTTSTGKCFPALWCYLFTNTVLACYITLITRLISLGLSLRRWNYVTPWST